MPCRCSSRCRWTHFWIVVASSICGRRHWACSCLFWAARKWRVSYLTCSSHLYVPPHFPHLRLSTLSDTLIIDWTIRCRRACGTYHRVSRHTRTIYRRTARYALLAPILSTRTRERNHDNEHRDLSYSDDVFALRSPFDEHHQRRLFVLSSDNVRDFSFPRNLLGKNVCLCWGC